jgi:hypothetical protein
MVTRFGVTAAEHALVRFVGSKLVVRLGDEQGQKSA